MASKSPSGALVVYPFLAAAAVAASVCFETGPFNTSLGFLLLPSHMNTTGYELCLCVCGYEVWIQVSQSCCCLLLGRHRLDEPVLYWSPRAVCWHGSLY